MADTILVTQATLPPMEEYIKEIESIWESHWLTNMGEKHLALEEKLKDYLQIPEITLFMNGHMALELLLQALELEGEVITTPFTFASTTHAIVRNGLTPVFADIRAEDYTLDPAKIEELITDKTCAILPVHVYGNVCQVEEIQRIADAHGLPVIYDAAHTFGVKYKGKGVAGFGLASMFSFHATKVFNTIEGGAVCHNDPGLGRKLSRLKNFGIRNQECVDGIGANGKMNEFQAAMGLCNLRHIEDQIAARKQIFECYHRLLRDVPGIRLTTPQADVDSNYAYFVAYVDETAYGHSRDELASYLETKNVFVRKYFYPITSAFDCYEGRFDPSFTPVALDASLHILSLPIYGALPLESVEMICREIAAFHKM